jgi:hypothetical protein
MWPAFIRMFDGWQLEREQLERNQRTTYASTSSAVAMYSGSFQAIPDEDEVLACISVHDSLPERVRFKVYIRNGDAATAAHLDHRIEFKDYKVKHATKGVVCIEVEFSQDPRHEYIRYVAIRLGDACVIDRTYHPDEANMRVIDDWQSAIGISEIVSALHRGEEVVTMELQLNDSDNATLVVTRMFRVKDVQTFGQNEAE